MHIYMPYTYYIKWSQTGVWYYGVEYSKTNKIANPKNLWTCYFTSSASVKEYRRLQGDPDIIKITKTFENSEDAIIWENRFLRRVNAKRNPKSLNGHNSDGLTYKNKIVSQSTRQKLSIIRKKNIWWNNGTDSMFRPEPPDDSWIRGRLLSYNPGAMKGAAANKSKKWFTDGSKNIFVNCNEAPEGFVLGRKMGRNKNPDIKRRDRKWWNNGIKESFDIIPPDSSYSLGRIRLISPT